MTLQEFFEPLIESGKLTLDVPESKFVKMARELGTYGAVSFDISYDVNIGKGFRLCGCRNSDGTRKEIFNGTWEQVYRQLKQEQNNDQLSFW